MLTESDRFKSFFREHLETIYRFARGFTGNADVARDVAQEAFIRLYERRSDFASREKARSFLYTTAKNSCLDYLKHRKVEQQYLMEQPSDEERAENLEEEFLHEVTYQETLRILRAAIEKLPPRGRAIILHSMNGKTNTEIAEEMQVSVNTIKTLKKSAYATLRELLTAR
ncbi:MAG: RNA polymerase sigma factor [Odoribacteraceae bacterium]|jgi:RNA polymerase sigma-70 factor (ECF subfamily)|nr:RNA polymerase sigma factor [Odoribacteraceae bacterium]